MKLSTSLVLLFLSLSGNTIQAQTTGGPDAFGYHWANNLDTIGSAPVYNWKDIKDSSNLVEGLGDDNSAGSFDLGFYYSYYGKWYNKLWIGSNGWVSFQNAGNITTPFPVIPNPSAPDNIIAPFLSDLTFKDGNDSLVDGAAAYFWTNGTDSIIVQYDSVPFWDTSSTGFSGRNSFQIIFNAADYSITFQYKQLTNSMPAYDLTNKGLKIGIEDSTGNDGLQALDTFPSDASAIKFYYPGHFSTNDLNNTGISLGQNFPNPASNFTTVSYSVKKSGNAKVVIHSMLGTQIESFDIGKVKAGDHTLRINTTSYHTGIYFYTLNLGGSTSTRKMVVVR